MDQPTNPHTHDMTGLQHSAHPTFWTSIWDQGSWQKQPHSAMYNAWLKRIMQEPEMCSTIQIFPHKPSIAYSVRCDGFRSKHHCTLVWNRCHPKPGKAMTRSQTWYLVSCPTKIKIQTGFRQGFHVVIRVGPPQSQICLSTNQCVASWHSCCLLAIWSTVVHSPATTARYGR